LKGLSDMSTIIQQISQLPDYPSRTNPTSFNERAEAWMAAEQTMTTQLNTFATQANALRANVNAMASTSTAAASEAASAASRAAGSVTLAETAASVAIAAAGATVYSAATVYTFGNVVIGSNGVAYRYIGAAGTSGDNPVTSTTGRWIRACDSLIGASIAINDIGGQGGVGFGVGICPPNKLPAGMFPLPGHDQLGHDSYGNYVTSNGSLMVYVPRFYYRIGSNSSPRYAIYGANAVDIASAAMFSNRAAAILAGWVLPRAFIDGGQELLGFFIDKYPASALGVGDCVSLPNVEPLSLTTKAGYSRTQGMTGCLGTLADAVVLGRARGAGFHCASIFQYSSLALLSLAHGQAATSALHCAWYDAGRVTNFPKGCNNNALRDVNDTSVVYASAGVSGSNKPKTHTIANFAKTTHNGQNCGVADLNGSLGEVALGLTSPGTSGASSSQLLNGTARVLKEAAALSSITAGFGGATDAWGTSASLTALYDEYTDLFPWGETQGVWILFGNGPNAVFSSGTDGVNFARTNCGIATAAEAYSATGTNLFGVDGNYTYNSENLFPLVGGTWNSHSTAGVFSRTWVGRRSSVSDTVGFRVALAAFG
jgi:hypothetical protein